MLLIVSSATLAWARSMALCAYAIESLGLRTRTYRDLGNIKYLPIALHSCYSVARHRLCYQARHRLLLSFNSAISRY